MPRSKWKDQIATLSLRFNNMSEAAPAAAPAQNVEMVSKATAHAALQRKANEITALKVPGLPGMPFLVSKRLSCRRKNV